MLVTLLGGMLGTVVVLLAAAQVGCFVVALYDMLNLPETHDVRLTIGALAGALRGWVVETVLTIAAVLAGPLGALPWRPIPRDTGGGPPPIVFVPGYLMTRVALWPLRHRLARDGWRHAVGYNYRTVGGDLRAAAAGLGALIDAVCARSGAARVVVVAHGMGGLVARLCLRDREGRGVLALVTLGTPHQGSKLYALALDPMLQEMRAGSALVEQLAADDALPARLDVTAIYASFDLTVVPSAAGRYAGAGNIEVDGVGHMGLVCSPRVLELVRENLEFAREHGDPAGGRR
jgi:triacylglycerol esterase/lipase EstA (alpha/beta hydrolase family)